MSSPEEFKKSSVEPPVWTPELIAKRRRRALIMAAVLLGLVVMFFLVTVVRLSDNIGSQGL